VLETKVLQDRENQLDWVNIVFLFAAHLVAVYGVYYAAFVHFSWPTMILSAIWLGCCSLSITGGYHRLFSHPTYKCVSPLRLFYLLFGGASGQNSALKWSSDHRWHHANTDEESDPYNIQKGFWWAHMGWVLRKGPPEDFSNSKDLMADPLILFQHRFYLPLAIVVGAVIPAALGALWGDMWGGLLLAGFLRIVIQYQTTFAINSVAHTIGTQPYDKRDSSRDSFVTALVTWGEGYHNFHHTFPSDYRNGIKFYHFDPTKWWVWLMSWVGVTRDLKRIPKNIIEKAKQRALISQG